MYFCIYVNPCLASELLHERGNIDGSARVDVGDVGDGDGGSGGGGGDGGGGGGGGGSGGVVVHGIAAVVGSGGGVGGGGVGSVSAVVASKHCQDLVCDCMTASCVQIYLCTPVRGVCSHPYARKSASKAVLNRMQLSLDATRPTPHGA